jgi:hypothetical protein
MTAHNMQLTNFRGCLPRGTLLVRNCTELLPESRYRTDNPVVLLRHEYRAVDKSHDSQPVLLERDVMRLRGIVFTEP